MSTWDEDSFPGDVGDAMLGGIVVAGGAGAPMPIDAVGHSGGTDGIEAGGGELDNEDWQSLAASRRRRDEDEHGEPHIAGGGIWRQGLAIVCPRRLLGH